MGESLIGLCGLVAFYGNVVAFVVFGAITTTLAQSTIDRGASDIRDPRSE